MTGIFYRQIAALIVLTLLTLFSLTRAVPALAGGVVTNCDDDIDFSSKLAGGGAITFNCGGGQARETIVLNSTKTIAVDTMINGGDKITLSGNFARRLFIVNNGVTLTFKNIILMKGYTPYSQGGGAILNNGHLILDHTTIDNIAYSPNGGAIATVGALDITSSTMSNNKALSGGAIYADGAAAVVNINSSVIYDNHATASNGSGGAIDLVNGATLNVTASSLYDNTAVSSGGALEVENGTATFLDVMLSENHSGVSGAINTDGGTTRLTNVTIANNSADLAGGGIDAIGKLTLENVTFSGNTSPVGGGLYLSSGVNATLNNVTFSANSSADGASIYYFAGGTSHLRMKNVLLANPMAGGNCDFHLDPDTSKHNLSSDGTCRFGAGHDNIKLKLGPLETNGGATLTHRLLPGSRAIDKGVSIKTIHTDQRGITRPRGAAFDVGAFEFVPCSGVPTKPKLLSPAPQENVLTQGALLDWAGPDCVKKFSVIVRDGSKQGMIVFSKTKIKPTQVMTGVLTVQHTYFWQVTACNASGCATSKWRTFTYQSN